MKVLVTGGAGYIGSHVVRMLQERGDEVVVVDDMSEGVLARIGNTKLIRLDLASPDAVETLKDLFNTDEIHTVVHLAARKKVGESVQKPEWYFSQNIGGMVNLLAAMRESGVKNLVFSSSAAAYGMPDVASVPEDAPCKPINPYGETKLVGEWLAEAAAAAWGLRVTNLRYFNVAGAGWSDLADTAVANLLPIVFAAIREGKNPMVFGDDYPTHDGSCVRDYVHVHDLASAHLAAIDYLDNEVHSETTFNVGTGQGSSVFEVIEEIKKVSGLDFKAEIVARRAGDAPSLSADVSRINKVLGWSAKHDLHDIVSSSWLATKLTL